MGLRKRKKVKRTFITLTHRAYAQAGGAFNRELASQCAYYPRFFFNKLLCLGCSLSSPKESCKRAHILEDTNIKRCELCWEVKEDVELIYHHSLCPACLERVIEAGSTKPVEEV